jgi:hypothetical protein
VSAERWSAQRVEALLAKRYAAPEYAFLRQVNEGTGRHAGRRVDAIAMSLWPSRGLDLHGFEIKVSRQDLRVELKEPEKADALHRYCNFWWLVVAPDVIGQFDTCPRTWGVLEARENGASLAVVRDAPRCDAEPPTLSLFAALLRAAAAAGPNFTEWVHQSDIEKTVAAGVADLKGANVAREIRSLRRTVDDLAARIGRATGTLDRTSTNFSNAQRQIEQIVETLARIESGVSVEAEA